eukprot:15164847-Alexandrium_andersonii.AAC.1
MRWGQGLVGPHCCVPGRVPHYRPCPRVSWQGVRLVPGSCFRPIGVGHCGLGAHGLCLVPGPHRAAL